MNSYLDLNFDVLHAATNKRYADCVKRRLVNLGPIALFSNYKLTTNSGKHSEDFSNAHIVSLVYKIITTATRSDDLLIRLNRDRNTSDKELTKNRNQKGNDLVRIMVKDVVGFAEHQQKATFGLGYKLT